VRRRSWKSVKRKRGSEKSFWKADRDCEQDILKNGEHMVENRTTTSGRFHIGKGRTSKNGGQTIDCREHRGKEEQSNSWELRGG